MTGEVQKQVSPGSIVITNEAVNQQLDFIGQWRLVETSVLNPGRARPLTMVIDTSQGVRGRTEESYQKYRGLNRQELFAAFSDDVWRWAVNKRGVYFIATKEEIDHYQSQLSSRDRLVRVAEIEVPAVQLKVVNAAGSRFPLQPPALPQGTPMYDSIFDLRLNGSPLLIMEWIRS